MILVLHYEVEGADVVKNKTEGCSCKDGIFEIVPSAFFSSYTHLDILHLDCVHDGPQRHWFWMFVGVELPELRTIGKGQVLYQFSDAIDDGEQMRHRHLLLDYVGSNYENHTGDQFFLMVGDDALSGIQDILFSSLNELLELTHY
jgi:hypothetical protein